MRHHYNIKHISFIPLKYCVYSAQSLGTVMHSSDFGIGYINEEVEIVHEWLWCKNLIYTMVELSWYQN